MLPGSGHVALVKQTRHIHYITEAKNMTFGVKTVMHYTANFHAALHQFASLASVNTFTFPVL